MSEGNAGANVATPPHQQQANPPPNATFTIQPPEAFDFSRPQQWEKWIRRFERFRLASNLHLSSEANQVNTLIYCMGDEADDILRGQALSDAQRHQYQAVRDTLDIYFVPRKNIIYERARFNQRVQQVNETVDSFVTALYALAENCNYGALHDELIRDRLVVGLRDTSLAERLQMDKDLTLEKAVNQARQSEVIKRQQTDIRGEKKADLDAVSVKYKREKHSTYKAPSLPKHKMAKSPNESQCYRCGRSPAHGKGQCPAKDVTCHTCGKRGHYSKVCKSVKNVHMIETEKCNETPIFLGSVHAGSDPWYADITIRNHTVRFKIDTGADVSVIPAQMYFCINQNETELCKPDRPLIGPGGTPLNVLGMCKETLCKGEQKIQENVYVIRDLHMALLSRPASVKLNLVSRADSIDIKMLNENYPKLCQGLGLMQQPYTIKLKPDAVPFSLSTPRRVPIPLLGKVKEELERMESIGVISRVEEPTEWCSGMVPVPTKSDSVRICVDLTHLNEAVCREKYILPSVEQTLGSLTGAKVFSKLDANRGFWQVPLAPESAHYTTFITPFGRFHFNRLPFGIASAPEHFQRRMSMILNGLPGVVCHMDDILIWGKDQPEHNARLHTVLKKLQAAGVTLNMDKCELSTQQVKFLGHVLSAEGVRPDPDKIRAVIAMKEPSNVSEVRSFLGMVNQLGKFISGLAEKDKPLRDLLSKKNQWVWSHAQQNAFDQLKNELASTPVLTLYDPNKDLKMSADASSYGLGAVLFQKESEEWRPVAYASRSLTETEQRYAQVEKEALGLTWGCERFKDFLIGRHFSLETDHKPLVSLLGQQALTELPPRIQRFRLRLMSDNGPQFSSQQFKDFAAAYGFRHVTSSPRFAQSNGEAERHVQTVKGLLKKAKDPYLALLAYRATPLANGYSPAQLLMGRRLRTPVPQLPSLLVPSLPNKGFVASREGEMKLKYSEGYNRRHRVRDLPQLSPGQPVWITDTKSEGTVISSHSAPRSYLVEGPSGAIRRNRHHLLPMPETTPKMAIPSTPISPTEDTLPTPNISESPVQTPKATSPVRTRFGRVVTRPQKLDL
ncbi:uncharacterized protein K02A2.6-like [Syngnathus typhle]|uniref:uncharacterized protein K02A2.6-like n=1 Tax=Syngnathus typhle TaxID=161592 RepID=UPI002A69CB82|nr:uncharacterized protein K02A2.6-like [Syngnathus typhle]